MRLDQYISELLFIKDCVIIPGLGGFVGNIRPAFLNPAHHTFTPPFKKIAFNASLRTNDGLLANHISEALDITYAEAVQEIKAFSDEILARLESGENVVIRNVGLLSLDSEKHIQFEPDSSVNHLPSSFGLSVIHSPAIRRDEGHNVKLKSVKAVRKKFSGWRILEIVPAAAILTLLAFNPAIIKNLNASLGSLVPLSRPDFEVKAPAQVEEVPAGKTIEISAVEEQHPENDDAVAAELLHDPLTDSGINASAPIPEPVVEAPAPVVKKTEPAVVAEPVTTDVAETASSIKPQKRYFVIGGCFGVYENAVNFQQAAIAEGYKAEIIGTNSKGLHMVSLFSSEARKETLQAQLEIQQEFEKNSWILRQ